MPYIRYIQIVLKQTKDFKMINSNFKNVVMVTDFGDCYGCDYEFEGTYKGYPFSFTHRNCSIMDDCIIIEQADEETISYILKNCMIDDSLEDDLNGLSIQQQLELMSCSDKLDEEVRIYSEIDAHEACMDWLADNEDVFESFEKIAEEIDESIGKKKSDKKWESIVEKTIKNAAKKGILVCVGDSEEEDYVEAIKGMNAFKCKQSQPCILIDTENKKIVEGWVDGFVYEEALLFEPR